ncbi:MAG TPA: hypothetical protein PK736_08260 [Bacteroidia bacterium]|nr:hypothetical protein [Bacteroidia bacterium]
MKKNTSVYTYSYVALILLIFVANVMMAQRIQSGKIIYTAAYIKANEKDKLPGGLPTQCVLLFNDKLYRTETRYENDSSIAVMITDEAAGLITQLLNFPGNKLAVQSKIKKYYKGQSFKLQMMTDTKKIAGYECTKIIITQDDSLITEAWYTKSIVRTGKPNKAFHNVDGAFLEYSVALDKNGTMMKYTATEVVEQKIADDVFQVPSTYKVCTQKKLNRMLGARFF